MASEVGVSTGPGEVASDDGHDLGVVCRRRLVDPRPSPVGVFLANLAMFLAVMIFLWGVCRACTARPGSWMPAAASQRHAGE